ncbi:MAG: glutathione S-transferase C-terminal domain-containing protein [Rhizobiales bacterium]|jgi:glutathione S-transferase|nr:glutathione S-transferase C-terminal domain-containing protein [Hyphomicrobiales bacterium]
MAEYKLYCFAQSGNSYKAALMLNLIGADWEPIAVDFFAGETRSPEFRSGLNEMGEAPVLEHQGKRLTQSGVILTYLSRLSGKFKASNEDGELEVLRWILFDNHKVTNFMASHRFFHSLAKDGDPAVIAFLRGRALTNLKIVDLHLAKQPYLVGDKPTIADISVAGYIYYPAEEHGFDIEKEFPNVHAWRERIKKLPGWKHPYDLMPQPPSALKK